MDVDSIEIVLWSYCVSFKTFICQVVCCIIVSDFTLLVCTGKLGPRAVWRCQISAIGLRQYVFHSKISGARARAVFQRGGTDIPGW